VGVSLVWDDDAAIERLLEIVGGVPQGQGGPEPDPKRLHPFPPLSRRPASTINCSIAMARGGRCSLTMFHVAIMSAR
jgi:hypothetical protein